jgi:hypothetical protein
MLRTGGLIRRCSLTPVAISRVLIDQRRALLEKLGFGRPKQEFLRRSGAGPVTNKGAPNGTARRR